jgi:hypothetical protein
MRATAILVLVNTLFILMALNLQQIGSFNLIMLILFMATALTGVLFYLVRQKRIAAKLALQASPSHSAKITHGVREVHDQVSLEETKSN